MKRFLVAVFGKQGCDKCKLLKSRLQKILAAGEYREFEMIYCDLGTVEGLVRFCQSESLNPQRIPSLIVYETLENGEQRLLQLPRRVSPLDEENMETCLSLETDYSGTGVLPPKVIRGVLDEALKLVEVEVEA